jgi:hypothetical protein
MPPDWLPVANTDWTNELALQRAADTVWGGVVAWHYGSARIAEENIGCCSTGSAASARRYLEQLMENAAHKRLAEKARSRAATPGERERESLPYDQPDDEGNGFHGEQTEGWERISTRAHRVQGGPAHGQIVEMRAYFAVIRNEKSGVVVVVSYLSSRAAFESGVSDVKDLVRRMAF